jgi:hypothetical protein
MGYGAWGMAHGALAISPVPLLPCSMPNAQCERASVPPVTARQASHSFLRLFSF